MTAPTNSPAALDVACPYCGVEAGESCEEVVCDFIGPVDQPHLYRVAVSAEVTR